MHRRSPSVLTLLLAAATVPAAAQQQGRAPMRYVVVPPPAVHDFRMLGQELLGGAEGMQVRYARSGDDDWIDVYVYPAARDSTCSRACDSVALNRESGEFAAMIPELLRRGYYDSLRVAADERVSVGGLRGRHLRLAGGRSGRVVTSQFYLLGAGELLVKVRATYTPSAAMDSVAAAFAEGFASATAGRLLVCTEGPPADGGLSVRFTTAGPPEQVAPRIEGALKQLGYTFARDKDRLAWETDPVLAWPARDTWAALRQNPHPGLRMSVEARGQGNGTEVTVASTVICGVPAQRALETSVALVAGSELLSQFPDAKK